MRRQATVLKFPFIFRDIWKIFQYQFCNKILFERDEENIESEENIE